MPPPSPAVRRLAPAAPSPERLSLTTLLRRVVTEVREPTPPPEPPTWVALAQAFWVIRLLAMVVVPTAVPTPPPSPPKDPPPVRLLRMTVLSRLRVAYSFRTPPPSLAEPSGARPLAMVRLEMDTTG